MRRLTILLASACFAGVANLVAILAAGAGHHSLAEIRGRINLDGCWDCEEAEYRFYECQHQTLEDPCDPNACIENILYYARCEETPESEEDDCEMHSERTSRKRIIRIIELDAPAPGCDETVGRPPGVPEEGDCQAPGFQGRGKCFLNTCPGDVIQDRVADRGRLVCGAP